MAPLATETTPRLWLDYVSRSGGVEHTIMVRLPLVGGTPALAQAAMLSFLSAMTGATFYAGWHIIRARYAEAGSTFSLPTDLVSGLKTFVGTRTGTYNGIDDAGEWTYQGRSATTGRRVDISLYGITPAEIPTATGRWVVGSTGCPSWVSNGAAALNATSDGFRTIDGSRAVWYAYVNYGRNSYWERRLRVS